MRLTLESLRQHAVATTLFTPRTLRGAVQRLGFVQADPIRSPARAQDLILRHRVQNYRIGDLDQRYRSLHFEEDYLYAYGFMPESTWQLLHRPLGDKLTRSEQTVLDIVARHKRIHPRDLETYLGRAREINAWGGYSKATTHALQRLHFRGLLRVAGRENGIRLYERVQKPREAIDAAERMRRLILLVAAILAPVPEQSLWATLNLVAHFARGLEGRKQMVKALLDSGELHSAQVEGLRYLWPVPKRTAVHAPERVRFLAPFDPLVWDRRRFEHLWGWPYRFEAYTPPPKRKLGYYAMPMLWRSKIVGWVNISARNANFAVTPGFATAKPAEASFASEFEAETERFRRFLRSSEENETYP